MFRNLGLDTARNILEVHDILEKLLLREYEFDGTGGLFPLGDWAEEDQRELEIWYQAQLFLMKNYDF